LANFRNHSRRVRSLLVTVSLLGLVLTFSACPRTAERKPQESTVGTQRVEALSAAQLTNSASEYIATVRANEETDFSFKVGGVVEIIGSKPRRDWEEGTAVKAGTLLARLQQSDFRNALASAKAAAELAASNNGRLQKLLGRSVISKQEADKATADVETTQAQFQQAEQNLRDSELRAPWDGVVFTRLVNSGETVSAGKPVLRFGDVRMMSVELGVPDRLVGLFVVDKEIDVDISSLAGRPPFRGKISEVGVAASNAGRLYRVVIKVPNPDGLIKSGMTATVKTDASALLAAGHVLVPLSALISPSPGAAPAGPPQGELAVFVVQDGKAVLRHVKTGDIVASSIIVTEGLKVGEEVVTKGASQLYEGAPVQTR